MSPVRAAPSRQRTGAMGRRAPQKAVVLTVGVAACALSCGLGATFVGSTLRGARPVEPRAANLACLASRGQEAAKAAVSKYSFKYGWITDEGRWYDPPKDGILKWWQRPSYLTPNGYPEPPHWSKANSALCMEEFKFAQLEANIYKDLKAQGMTREEIDARAAMYEFLEDDGQPKMTQKMKHLMQVACLAKGLDDFEVIDMRKNRPKGEPKIYKKERTKLNFPKPA
eukprot:CAMPEP_0117472250 /NCGR_PEP_ID=MMETSP0784-20121206/8146_1 /TAXON_ID=39447 /ORGANISM="" /LENGTH=225 /DNA_ID=CAMNT_0005266387 /DNA_START=41 /DNA_END=718 /DNA_ORIENTATION=+